MHVLAYWLARLALVFAVFVALWGVGWTPGFAFLAAAAIAWLISYAMFGSMHDAAARQMERWVSRRFAGVAGEESGEDGEAKVEGAPSGRAEAAIVAATATKPVVPGSASSKPVARTRAAAKPIARVKPVDAPPVEPKATALRSG